MCQLANELIENENFIICLFTVQDLINITVMEKRN